MLETFKKCTYQLNFYLFRLWELWADGAFLGTQKSVKISYVHEENIIASAHTLEFQRKRGVTGSPILEFRKES